MILMGIGILVLAILLTLPTVKERKWKSIIDVFAEGVTCVAFLVIFVVFMAQIIARYFFKSSISWSNEISILGYMYCMYFGTGRALTHDEHVVFSLVYDKLKPEGKLAFKLIYNVAMIVLLAVTIVPSYNVITSMKNVTGVLKMPYKVVFFPYMWMLIETILRCAYYIKQSLDEYKLAKSGAKEAHA